MELLQTLFAGPNLIPTVVLLLVMAYWVMVIVGAMDFEMFDLDLDLDGDIDVSAGASGIGFLALRFLNIGQVPLMLWATMFAFAFSVSSFLFAQYWDDPETFGQNWSMAQYTLRNGAVAVLLAKLVTNPMRGWFKIDKGIQPEQLVGRECELTTEVVPDALGQARFRTGAAPLLLNVRCKNGRFTKGETATIVEYTSETKTYWIEHRKPEV